MASCAHMHAYPDIPLTNHQLMDSTSLVWHQCFTSVETIFPDEIALVGITAKTETYSRIEFILKYRTREQLILDIYLCWTLDSG